MLIRVAAQVRLLSTAVCGLFLAIALALLVGLGIGRGLNHDEHQFVASGKLVASGLTPYKDFPYFHSPLLSLVNGLLFRFAPAQLLTARLVSVLSGWLSLVVLFFFTWRRLAMQPLAGRLLASASVVLLLMSASIFVHTSGRAWNHDLPMLLALLAFLLQRRLLTSSDGEQVDSKRRLWSYLALLFGSGLLVGLATSARLTFVALAPVFALSIWFAPAIHGSVSPARQRWLSTLAFTAGGLLGGVPLLKPLWQSPEAFWFGNIEYIQLNTQYYRIATRNRDAMTLPGKLLYCVRLFTTRPGNLLLALAWAGAVWSWMQSVAQHRPAGVLRHGMSQKALLLFHWGMLLFTLSAALGATPSQPQYFFALLPWMAVGISEGIAALKPAGQQRAIYLLSGASGLAGLLAAPSYLPALQTWWQPGDAYAWKIHSQAPALATLIDQGEVLTLAPIYVLEAEIPIEPALATGPFAWRVADLVAEERRARLGLLGPAALSTLWASSPPRAVLATAEGDDAVEQRPLVEAAAAHGYVPVATWDDNTLWLSTLAEWGSANAPAIRLGAHTLPRGSLSPGETFAATFYLQNVRPIGENLNVLVRLVGANGQEVARSEGWPWGSATSTWVTGEVWPDGHTFSLPQATAAGYYRVEMSFYEPLTLATFGEVATVDYIRVGMQEAGPAAQLARVGDQFALVQAAIGVGGQPPMPVRAEAGAPVIVGQPGDVLALDLLWQAQTRPISDYTVFVHLVGPDGVLHAQRDQPPLNGFFPTRFWRPGDSVADKVELVLPPDAPPGDYQLWVGMYESVSLQRLPVEGAGAAERAAPLGTIQIVK